MARRETCRGPSSPFASAFRPFLWLREAGHRVWRRGNPRLKLVRPSVNVFLVVVFIWLALWMALSPVSGLTAGPTIQLCIALDGSSSIETADFAAMKEGLAAAIEDSNVVPQNGAVELTVLEFGGIIYEVPVIVEPTVINSAATASTAANAVRAASQSMGFTPTHLAIDTCRQKITASANFATALKQNINITTDGDPSQPALTVTARDNAVAAGIDEIDLEAVGSQPSINNMLEIAYPRPGYVAPPFNGGGFVIRVNTFADYANAIRQKLQEILPQPTATVGGPTPTRVVGTTQAIQNGSFETEGNWTPSQMQRTNSRAYAGGWSMGSTAGAYGRLYQFVNIPSDVVRVQIVFYWLNQDPDISNNGTCYDYLQLKIMNTSLTQTLGQSSQYCTSTTGWNVLNLDLRPIMSSIRGQTVAVVFEAQQDSLAPHTVFFIDDVRMYFYRWALFLPEIQR